MNVAKHIRYEIQEVIGLYCITLEDGQKIYDAMISELRSGHSIELDFRGVRIVAPPFLNAAIGQLMRDQVSESFGFIPCHVTARSKRRRAIFW
jgi:hypothetical protein